MVKEFTPREARQGRRGTRVLTVLVCALLLAIIAWGAVEIYGYMIAPETPSGDPATPVPGDEPQPAPAAD